MKVLKKIKIRGELNNAKDFLDYERINQHRILEIRMYKVNKLLVTPLSI